MSNPTRRNLLLADNNASYRHSLCSLLELENFTVEEASSVEEAQKKLTMVLPDLALVDLRLTNDEDIYDISGLEIAKSASERNIPCVIISAFPSVEATRLALRSRGAEPLAVDFVPKSAGPEALLDAINTILGNRGKSLTTMYMSGLEIDLDQRLVWRRGELLDLSRYQYALLVYLYQKKGTVTSPEELIQAIYEEEVSAKEANIDRRLEHLVERLREKIEDDPSNPHHLLKVHRRGFRLVLDD